MFFSSPSLICDTAKARIVFHTSCIPVPSIIFSTHYLLNRVDENFKITFYPASIPAKQKAEGHLEKLKLKECKANFPHSNLMAYIRTRCQDFPSQVHKEGYFREWSTWPRNWNGMIRIIRTLFTLQSYECSAITVFYEF